MIKKCIGASAALFLALSLSLIAEDAKTVLGNASKAMGIENVNSVMYYGSGANFTLGQSNNANGAWPRTNLSDYTRAIDFMQPASRATAVTWAAPVTGGPAVQGAFNQNVIPANNAWAQQLEIWITPWGFIKGAIANNATSRTQTVSSKRYNVVTWMTPQKSPSGQPYKVVGYISGETNLVDKVDTWLENPIFGDMLVEGIYTDYRDNNGFKFPATMVQKRGGSPTFEAQLLGATPNPRNIQQLLTPPAGGQRGGGGAGGAAAAAGPTSEKLADGVYRINGAYNAMAIEFKDHIVLWEGGPQSDARSQAIIAEARKVIPNKPIRYSILSHHHFDHSSGLPALVAEGVTIITHDLNKAFLEKALNAPRTLAPDAMSKSGKKPKIETVTEKRVLQDETRTVEIHHVVGLPHADGMLMVYLPKEKILAYADMFNLPPANDPVPNPPVVGTMVFLDNIERLKLQPEKLLSVHSLIPDRLATMVDIRKSLGKGN
ncbi:MAG TPA: MBL fold metallo-hydrolase [Terriglobia bacterium]|nr:MBL fold metallo-hydrolase [Terriglobia bacterium]